jgi:hypothetical protein
VFSHIKQLAMYVCHLVIKISNVLTQYRPFLLTNAYTVLVYIGASGFNLGKLNFRNRKIFADPMVKALLKLR